MFEEVQVYEFLRSVVGQWVVVCMLGSTYYIRFETVLIPWADVRAVVLLATLSQLSPLQPMIHAYNGLYKNHICAHTYAFCAASYMFCVSTLDRVHCSPNYFMLRVACMRFFSTVV
jgi:hypothetical protein